MGKTCKSRARFETKKNVDPLVEYEYESTYGVWSVKCRVWDVGCGVRTAFVVHMQVFTLKPIGLDFGQNAPDREQHDVEESTRGQYCSSVRTSHQC